MKLTLLITFFSLLASASEKLEVYVYPYSEVPANEAVRLGLIAGPDASGFEQFAEIENIEILQPRKAGEKSFVSQKEMANALKEAVSSSRYTFRIPNQIIVESKENLIPQLYLARKIIRAAQDQCAGCVVKIRDMRVPEIPRGRQMKSWDLDFTGLRVAGSNLIPLVAKMENGQDLRLFVQTQTHLEKLLPVSKRTLAIGERLSEQDVELKYVNVTFEKQSLLEKTDIVGKLVGKYLAVGQPFHAMDIKREPAAARGQIVRVLAGDENFEVSIQAQAEEPGFVGDIIKIKNTDSQKFMSGQLIEKGVVKLQ